MATIKTDKTEYTPTLGPKDPPGNTPTGVKMKVSWTGAGPKDWFGVMQKDPPGWPSNGADTYGNTVDWKYCGRADGSQTVVVPTNARGVNYGGVYAARLFTNDGYEVGAESEPITVLMYGKPS